MRRSVHDLSVPTRAKADAPCTLQVTCTPINLQSLRALDTSSGWSRFQVTLTQFAGGGGAGGGGSFNGCGGLGFWDVTAILLRNGGSAQQMVCVSSVQLLS